MCKLRPNSLRLFRTTCKSDFLEFLQGYKNSNKCIDHVDNQIVDIVTLS